MTTEVYYVTILRNKLQTIVRDNAVKCFQYILDAESMTNLLTNDLHSNLLSHCTAKLNNSYTTMIV